MPRPTGPSRPTKQFHCVITAEEHRRIKIVAALEGKDVTVLFREVFLPLIDARYSQSSRRNGSVARGRTA